MHADRAELLALAQAEVASMLHALPRELRVEAERVPVTFEARPGRALLDDGIEPDTLGLFVGEPFSEAARSPEPLPAQVILFLENLWDAAEGDRSLYCREVRTTFMHELGHYLGLEEIDLEERGLE